MASRRMFSIDVTETDNFLGLPLTAQALYFHLGMQGDDDGFVSNPRSIMRITGFSEQDLTVLVESGYIITFRSGVIVISDWKVNNYLRGDRHKPTIFQDEFSQLRESTSRRYIFNCIPSDNQMTTQNSIEKNSVVVDAATAAAPRTDSELAEIVQYFQAVIGPFPRSALEKLQRYQESFSTELICKAIDEAAENGMRRWRYVDGVLSSWKTDGVQTLGDVAARREARKKPEQQSERKMEVLL